MAAERSEQPEQEAAGKEKPRAAPLRSPDDLANLVSDMPNQQKAEITYDLVFFAACAAAGQDTAKLNVFLAELEDMAEVYADPERRRKLQREVEQDARQTSTPTLPVSAE